MRKFNVIDLFSGCGGISKGFFDTGKVNIVGAIDFNQAAINTFQLNFPDSKAICGDINEITVESSGFKNKGVDIIIGGPPCQGFSALNRWSKELHDDPRNKLFFQFLRFVEEIKPKALLIENVRQILTSNNGFAKKNIENILTELGYNVSFEVLDCSDFGVPQSRKRAFFVGVRKDLGKFDFAILDKYRTEKICVEDAISDIAAIEKIIDFDLHDYGYKLDIPLSEYQKEMRASDNKIYDHLVYYPTKSVLDKIKYVPEGGNWKFVPEELFKSKRENRHSNYLKRLDRKIPSITIDTGHNMYFHYLYDRVPTIRESARLQSFPDDFKFTGNKGERFRQVGNAVPPKIAKVLALAIMEVINV